MLSTKWNRFWAWYLAPAPAHYCPVRELLINEPESWNEPRAWSVYTGELTHRTQNITIVYSKDSGKIESVLRRGHELPVYYPEIKKALRERLKYFKNKKLEAARAELNRLDQDIHTERVSKIMEYKSRLAREEALEIEFKLRS